MTKSIRIIVFFIAFSLVYRFPLLAGTIGPHLRKTLQQKNPQDEVSVIITLADQKDLKQFKDKDKKIRRSKINRALREKAEKTQKSLKKFLRTIQSRKIKSFWIFNGIAATVSAGNVSKLATRSEVQSVTLDRTLSLPVPVPTAAGVAEWNLDAINAPALWALGHTGTGIVIANMDTGVDIDHPDLSSRWRGGSNSWYDPHDEYESPYDTDGHGTQTMGIMVGGDAGGSSIGVAPDAKWIAVKLFSDKELTLYSHIHDGFQWLLDPDNNPLTDDAPDIVNNSWGFDQSNNLCITGFETDIQNLKDAGIAIVFSAGNNGLPAPSSISPANYAESFAVGSVADTLTVDVASSRGPSACDPTIFPEIVAPGVSVKTADLTFGGVIPNPYAYVSGTSFAAPHVSGAMALLISASPQLTVAELETVLAQYATDLGTVGADNDYGNGLLNVAAAYNSFATHLLAANVIGDGRGKIATYPLGIYCPEDCSGEYIEGTVVTLTAIPDSGSSFKGWAGDCTGQSLTCQITLDQARNVFVEFQPFPWEMFLPAFTRMQD